MIARWKRFRELNCVKRFGFGHHIAHYLGIAHPFRCLYSLGKYYEEDE